VREKDYKWECMLTRYTGRLCSFQREYPVCGSFTRVVSPPANRSSNVFDLKAAMKAALQMILSTRSILLLLLIVQMKGRN
jgi:hypothetical protein